MGRMDILLIGCLTVLNGLFAMSEMALAASRKARLAAMQEAGDKGAGAALALMAQPTRFLSTVQVGITSIGMLNGILGEAAFSGDLARVFELWGWSQAVASALATAVVVTAITFITIVFGELVPKRIGQIYPEPVARWVARPMQALAKATAPFVRLLSVSTLAVLRLMGVRAQGGPEVTQEEISASLAEGVSAGLIEAQEHQMVRNVFHLDDRPLTSIMTPRSDIVWLEAGLSPAQALARIRDWPEHQQHSWYPVCREDLSHVLGAVRLSALLGAQAARAQSLAEMVRPVDFVPETQTGLEWLERLRGQSSRLVFVVDEYGDVQGMVTPLDLLQAITGELQPETQTEAWATARPDGSWLLDGLMPVAELKSRLAIPELPDEQRGRYNTLAGLVLHQLGRLPVTGERLSVSGWTFEVVDLDGRRIDKILAVRSAEGPLQAGARGARAGAGPR